VMPGRDHDSDAMTLGLLPLGRSRGVAFMVSFAAQAVAAAALLSVTVLMAPTLIAPQKLFVVTELINTIPTQPQEARPSKLSLAPAAVHLAAPRTVLPVPRQIPAVNAPTLAAVKISSALPQLPPSNPAVAGVRTEVFSNTGSQPAPELARPARSVQTGGFGDPGGAASQGEPGKRSTIAHLGSFDLPAGAGNGNGNGGANGVRGTVTSAGFGTDLRTSVPDRAGTRQVQQGGFASMQPVRSTIPRAAALPPRSTPVEIVSKPTPVYSDEARRMHLEGEVLLEVNFTAGGQCQVNRVLHGLGHGLDEAAIRSAEQIRFRPATRDGQVVDAVATLHIVFQLAS
jgi:TonB family protein